jgi:hypothetical protein
LGRLLDGLGGDAVKCERQLCGATAAEDDVFDACAQCGRTLCHYHMADGCCTDGLSYREVCEGKRVRPAISETVARACGTLGRLRAKHLVKRPAILISWGTGADLMHPECMYEDEPGIYEYLDIWQAAEWWQDRELGNGAMPDLDGWEEGSDYCTCDGCGKEL